MTRVRAFFRAAIPAVALAGLAAAGTAEKTGDPLAAEIERLSAILRNGTESSEIWNDVKQGSQPALDRAEQALRDGRRLLAIQRLAPPMTNVVGAAYVAERPAAVRTDSGFEAERERMGGVLRAELGQPSPSAFDGVQPAAVRALGEAALPQVRAFYDASLDYARNTMPVYGLFYLGSAKGAHDFAAFARELSQPAGKPAPPLRSLAVELDALETEMLKVYRPPASIDRHAEFIAASAALKEARELDAAGLRYGALLRYLQAALRFAPLRPAPATTPADALETKLASFDSGLSAGTVDDSIGRIFLEAAQSDLAQPPAGSSPVNASAIVDDVLPRFFAALEPAPPAARKPAPDVTVTLVRWPYT
jgi:hypothetical protein